VVGLVVVSLLAALPAGARTPFAGKTVTVLPEEVQAAEGSR